MDSNSSQAYDDSRLTINITGGPLSYRYRFEEMHIHYGLHDQYGSEHSVQGYTFPAEVSSTFPTFTIRFHSVLISVDAKCDVHLSKCNFPFFFYLPISCLV